MNLKEKRSEKAYSQPSAPPIFVYKLKLFRTEFATPSGETLRGKIRVSFLSLTDFWHDIFC
ncbi:Uncharacterized protein dnm_087240 [Desulfonema magnum]|uniref:Uncharacterized protein n=1 Tax=Desulfonema magnum TaxID=45655 RepID=A0A975GT53_9BACT|nr:Uncharacterized protein dnm_087240 [Desulfonema magnum]